MKLPKYGKRLLTKLRCGSLKLALETGRYDKVDRNQRICELCNTGIEDGYHFIMVCGKLQHIREKYIGNITKPRNIYSYYAIMRSDTFNTVRNMCWFIQEAWEYRQSTVTQMCK